MTIAEKVAYIQGMFDGMGLDKSDKGEAKILAEMLDVLKEVAGELETVDATLDEFGEEIDAISDDLADVENALLEDDEDEDEDEDDEEEECFMTNCPECEEEVYFDESVLEDGEVICPNCGAKLEFDLSDLANDEGEDEE
mgnify:CR=1 FL=1